MILLIMLFTISVAILLFGFTGINIPFIHNEKQMSRFAYPLKPNYPIISSVTLLPMQTNYNSFQYSDLKFRYRGANINERKEPEMITGNVNCIVDRNEAFEMLHCIRSLAMSWGFESPFTEVGQRLESIIKD